MSTTKSVSVKLKRNRAKKVLTHGEAPGVIRQGYDNLQEWLKDPQNVYVGRRGRIFINKKIFHYPGSKWHNPFTLKKYTLNQSLILYVTHLLESGLINDIEELRGKTLGCFCSHHTDHKGAPTCHAQVLVQILEKCNHILKKE